MIYFPWLNDYIDVKKKNKKWKTSHTIFYSCIYIHVNTYKEFWKDLLQAYSSGHFGGGSQD